jgi:hypothetical protein
MDRIKKKVNKIGFLWALVSIILFIGLCFALIGLAEFFNVAIVGEPRWHQSCWGDTREVPWYYQNSNIYSSYNLISGLLFLIVTILTLSARIQKKKMLAITGALIIIILFIAEFIGADITTFPFQ